MSNDQWPSRKCARLDCVRAAPLGPVFLPVSASGSECATRPLADLPGTNLRSFKRNQ